MRERKACVVAPKRKREKVDSDDFPDNSGSDAGSVKRPRTASSLYKNGSNGHTSSPQAVKPISPHIPWNNFAPAHNPVFQPQPVSNIAPKPPHQSLSSAPARGKRMHFDRNSNIVDGRTANFLSETITNSQDALRTLQTAATGTENVTEEVETSPSTRGLSDGSYSAHTGNTSGHANEALQIWAKQRFVRAGWFTAHEAMAYLDFFYERIAPLTPIALPDYRQPPELETLFTEERLLAVTILSIAARYAELAGPAHATRRLKIQDMLYDSLRRLINNLLWSEEQFGGGFCGGGAVKLQEAKSGQITWKGSLRTLGTVEALLLLTDWQPASLHFPPGDDEYLLLSEDDEVADIPGDEDDTSSTPGFASWLEPQWRSDRASWMLIGLAQSLSFELGVFDEAHLDSILDPLTARKHRVRRLVLIYVSQTSGRLGITSTLSLSDTKDDYVMQSTTDKIQKLWLHIASIMNRANKEIFPSKEFTRELTKNGLYKGKVDEFSRLLQEWKAEFDKVFLDNTMKHIILMEYEYARLYINSLGLQAIVGQWAGLSDGRQHVTAEMLRITYRPNQKYVDEVHDAAHHILESTLQALVPNGHLRQATTRTYSRVLSGLLFSLKCLVFGCTEPQFRESFALIEETTKHLRDMVVDDVHLASYSADLVSNLSKHMHKHCIRFSQPGQSYPPSRGATPYDLRQEVQAPSSRMVTDTTSTTNHGFTIAQPQWAHASFNDPLVDIGNMTESYMPPPDFMTTTLDHSMPRDVSLMNGENGPDWCAFPLSGIINNSMQPVDQGYGGIGLTIGSKDLLSYIGDPNEWGDIIQRYPETYPH
ncbi:MAG: hypothetical protein Q9227_005558 [Pyrenula ochraceoflavens]